MLSNAETALLGLLAEKPAHAWQLQKQVEHRDMRSWTDLAQSTIYKQLRALESDGLVESTDEIAEGRLRKVYAITPIGREALAETLLEFLRAPERLKARIDLATYNVEQAPRERVLRALAEYGDKVREEIEGWRALESYLCDSGCPTHRLAIARRSVRILEGELVWLAEFVEELEA